MSSRHSMIRRGEKSAVAAVCYITASRGTDERTGQSFDYGVKGHVADVQVMLPEGSPEWMRDPVKLMAAAELYEDVWAERRYKTPLYQERHKASAMVAHTAHYSLHHALRDEPERMWAVIETFVKERYTAYGVGAVVAVHDEAHNLHFHVQATKRVVEDSLEGFGRKASCFDSPMSLSSWAKDNRSTLARLQNEALASLEKDGVVEHRSFLERDIDLEAALHRGELGEALIGRGDFPHVALENQAIEARNRAKILDNPGLILEVLGASRATFTEKYMLYEITRRMQGDEALIQEVWKKVQEHHDLVRLPCCGDEEPRYTTRTYQRYEERMFDVATQMHGEEVRLSPWVDLDTSGLKGGQEEAAWALSSRSRLVMLRGAAGVGKTTLLRPVARFFEDQGYRVRGLALAGVAVEGLRTSLGCDAQTIAAFLKREEGRAHGKVQSSSWDLSSRDVVIIDEAGMVDVPTLSKVLRAIEKSRALVRLVGDPEQLKPIGAGDGFRGLWERLGGVSLAEVVRQKDEVDREAISLMSQGHMDQGLGLMRSRMVWHDTSQDLHEAMVRLFIEDKIQHGEGGLMLAFLRRDVKALNEVAREKMREKGFLTEERSFLSDHRSLGIGESILFLEKDRDLGVVNGTLGEVIGFTEAGHVRVKVDSGREIVWDVDVFSSWDYGYAMTVHKSQGVTVRQAWMKADRMLGSEGHYVGLSRHQDTVTLMVDRTVFKDEKDLFQALTRGGRKDLIQDYVQDGMEEALARYTHLRDERWDRSISEERRTQSFKEFKEMAGELVKSWDKVASKARLQGLTLSTLERQAGFRVRPSSSHEKEAEERVHQYQEAASHARSLWHTIRRTHPGRLASTNPEYGRFSEVRSRRDALASEIVQHKDEHRTFIALHQISHKALISQAQAHEKRIQERTLQEQAEQQRLEAHKQELGAKTAQAQHLLTQSRSISGTVAETYLREHRGVRETDFPDDLRFLSQGANLPSGHTTRHPALMAVGRDAEGKVSCVQLISLDEATGKKASLETPKRTYGALSGSWVCIQKGEAHQPVVIAEGVETALSLKEAGVHQGAIYSTLGIHNLNHAQDFILESRAEVILAADQDGPDAPSHKIVGEVAHSLHEQGHKVSIARPSSTPDQPKRDWNDVLRQEGVQGFKKAFEEALEKVHEKTPTQDKKQAQDKHCKHEDALHEQGTEDQHTKKEARSSERDKGLRGRYNLHALHQGLKQRVHEIAPKIVTCPLDGSESSRTHMVFKDKTQKISLCVQGDKAGLWYDFKRGKGGNLIDLLQDQHKLSKAEAIHRAAHLVGLEPEPKTRHTLHTPLTSKNHGLQQEKALEHEKALPHPQEKEKLPSGEVIKASYDAHMPFLKRSFKLQKEVMLFEEKKFARDVIKGLQEGKGEVPEQGFVLSALQTSRLQGRLRVESVIQGNPQSEDLLKKDAIKVALQTHSRLEGFQKELETQGWRADLVSEGKQAFLGHLQRYGQEPNKLQKEHIMRVVEAAQPLKEHMDIPKGFEHQKNALWTYCVDRVLVSMRDGRSFEAEALKTKIQAISKQLQINLRVMTRQIEQERAQDITHDLTPHSSRGRDLGW